MTWERDSISLLLHRITHFENCWVLERGEERETRVWEIGSEMAEEEVPRESLLEKLKGDHSSSSDSDSEMKKIEQKVEEKVEAVKDGIYRLFGRKRPVHHVLGGGKPADVFLWRNKKISAGAVGGATAVWVLFELLEYHLLALVCHCLILSLSILFVWSNASALLNKSSPHIPEVHIPEDLAVNVALSLRNNINCVISSLRDIASGKDIKKFLGVIAGLWFLSIVGSSCNFLTLFYIVFILVHTLPVLYEKYDDKVDAFAEKAMAEIKKQYAVFDAKVLSKIPKGPLKDKKH